MLILILLICSIIFAVSANELDKSKQSWKKNYSIGGIYTPSFGWSILKLVAIIVAIFTIYIMVIIGHN